jgi:hypothetical protein
LRLVYWNADGIRGRKLELDQFLSEHGVDICLLNETHLESDRPFRLANYVCHRTDREARGGGTAILVHRVIDRCAVPVSGLQHLEATSTHLVLASRPVKIVAAYLSPTRPLIVSDLTACLSGGFPVLMSGDLNAKHTDWNSRLITTRGALLRDYADRYACPIYGPDSPTTVPYQQNTNPVLDIVVVKDFVLPLYLTVCPALSSDHLPVLIDTTCRTSFQRLLDRPDFKRVDWAAYQACLEDRLPGNPVINDEESIDKCVEELSSAIQEALAASAPKSRPRADPRPPLPAGIGEEMHLKIRLKGQWQVTRDPALKSRSNRLQRSVTHRLNKWRNEQWSDVLESPDSADQSLWKLTKRVMRVPTPLPPLLVPGGLALSDSEKAEALADSLEAQFQPVNDPSSPAVTEAVDEVMRAYKYAPASELKLTSPSQVQEAVQGLKVGKAPGPNGVPNRALTHLPKREITFIMKLFNAVLRRQYFPPAWKHARVISILKPEKDPTLPSSYRPISLLYTVDKLFEKILLTRVLREVNERGLLRDEQFGFRPRHSTALQLARLVERVNRNFDERRLTGAVFLDVAKAFGNVWVEGLLYKLAILNFPFYLVKTLSSYLHRRTFQTSFNSATPTRRTMRAGVAQGGLVSPVLFSPYVNDMPTPSRHVELALYVDDTALIATSRSPLLLVTYLETYLNRLELWLRDWRIAINVLKSTAVLFTKTTRRVQRPRPSQ